MFDMVMKKDAQTAGEDAMVQEESRETVDEKDAQTVGEDTIVQEQTVDEKNAQTTGKDATVQNQTSEKPKWRLFWWVGQTFELILMLWES